MAYMTHVFISHIVEEKEVALKLKEYLERDFLKKFVFVSSDDLKPGMAWFEEIIDNLQKTKMLLLMCSPRSINKPWLHFEAGAIFIQKKIVIPICYSGLRVTDLPPQFSRMQAVSLENPIQIQNLYETVANRILACNLPQVSFHDISQELLSLMTNQKILFIVSPNLKDKYYPKDALTGISPHFKLQFIDYSEIDLNMPDDAYKTEYIKIVYHHPNPNISDPNYIKLIEKLTKDNASLPLITFAEGGNCVDFSAGRAYNKIVFAAMPTTLIQRIND